MPALKPDTRPRTLTELRAERDLAESWLRDAVEDYVDAPLMCDAREIAEDYLPRYRRAHARVRAAERRHLREA